MGMMLTPPLPLPVAVANGGTGSATAANARTALGLGTAAVKNTGVSGDALAVLNGAATTWGAGATFNGDVTLGGANYTLTFYRANGSTTSGQVQTSAGGEWQFVAPFSKVNFQSRDGYEFYDDAAGTTSVALLSSAGVLNVIGSYQVDAVKVVGNQGAAVADATDAASAITQLNALLARCRAHGLIAT